MRASFPLFQSHLDLAHRYWAALLHPGDWAIDATCGNGHDALYLCQHLFQGPSTSRLFLIDKQAKALQITKERLTHHFGSCLSSITFLNQCHSCFSDQILPASVKLIVYNLGYLPCGNKTLTTQSATTVASLQNAIHLLVPGGALSITCYPGHTAGSVEEAAVLEFASSLDPRHWSCCTHRWNNRHLSPSFIFIQKKE